MSPLLECTSLDVAYGPVQVLFGVDFSVEDGEVLALLGTNGAGKSTLLRAVAGLTPPSSGTATATTAKLMAVPVVPTNANNPTSRAKLSIGRPDRGCARRPGCSRCRCTP